MNDHESSQSLKLGTRIKNEIMRKIQVICFDLLIPTTGIFFSWDITGA
jgi:hypothetical protein